MISSTSERLSLSRKPTAPASTDRAEGTSNGSVTDETLLVLIRDGHQPALTTLFERHFRAIRSIATRVLRDSGEVEDLVQDLFLFVQQKSSTYDSSKSTAGSWIIHMAYQHAIDRKRRLVARHFYTRKDIHSDAGQVVGKATTEDDYSPEAVFGRNGLEKVIGELSKDQQETLRLYFFEGYTLSEISVKIGQPLGNVRNHYYRALDKLRKHMFGRKVRNG